MEKVKPGDPFRMTAETFNTFVDAARDFKMRQQGGGARPLRETRQPGIVLVKNDDVFDIERFEAMRIEDSMVISPTDNLIEFKNRPVPKCKGIDDNAHIGRWVIAQEPIPAGKFGRACISGITPAKIDVGYAGHTHADAADKYDSGSKLRSGWYGAAEILWKQSGTGEKWAVVRLGTLAPWPIRFELKDAIYPGSDDPEAYLVDEFGAVQTGCTFEVYDPFGYSGASTGAKYQGRGKNQYSSPHNQGSRGLAMPLRDGHELDKLAIIDLTPPAEIIQGEIVSDFTTAAGAFSLTNVTVLSPQNGLIVRQDPGSNITVSNTFGWRGKAGDTAMAIWAGGTTWRALQVECS